MKKIADEVALLKKVALYEINGIVESETTRTETEVHGEAGNPGNGPIAGRIETKTTRFQTIYLKDDDGGKYAVELVDFVIPCREGHELTIRGADKRLWFDVVNRSTGQSFENGAGLTKYAFPDTVVFGGAIAAAGFALLLIFLGEGGFGEKFFVGAVAGALVGAITYGALWVPSRIVASMRAAQIRARLRQAIR